MRKELIKAMKSIVSQFVGGSVNKITMRTVISELRSLRNIADYTIKNAKRLNLPTEEPQKFIVECDAAVTFLEEVSVKMPNGFPNWHETHFEVVSHIHKTTDYPGTLANHFQKTHGSAGLYSLASVLTSKFEVKYLGKVWDGEFIDTVHGFLEEQDRIRNINWFIDEM